MPVFIHSTGGGVDVASTTASPSDVLSGKEFFLSDGTKASGTIQSVSAKEHVPGASNIIIPAGSYLLGDQVIKGDSNLTAGNIKSGVNIFGVLGSYSVLAKTMSGTFSGYSLEVNTGFRPIGVIVSTTNSRHMSGDIVLTAYIFNSNGTWSASVGAYCYDDNGQHIKSGGGYIIPNASGFKWSGSSVDTNEGYVEGYMRNGRWYAVGI